MQQVNSPARYAHHLVNECGTAVQTALDERQGLRLRVVQPPYNDGRTKSLIGDALSRETPEQGKEALATGLGTAVKDAGNEFMKQNAEQRSRAGFTVTVERTGGANCCPWCADRVGRWELKNAPKDVFGVHDNCTCMVTYTNSRGVRSQRLGRSRFVEVGYQPHVNLTKDLEKNKPVRLTKSPNLEKPKRLTGGANGGILNAAITLNSFAEADPKEVVSKDCREKIIQVLKSQGFSFDYDDVRIADIPPDKEGRYEAIRTNAIATPSYPIVYLELNKRVFAGRTLEEVDEIFNQQDYCLANSLEEAIIHECGHLRVIKDKSYAAYERIDETLKDSEFTAPIPDREDKKSLRDLAGSISPYAQKDGLECIAESEVVLYRGEKLLDELKKLYDKYTS
jgi:hypothetical protein